MDQNTADRLFQHIYDSLDQDNAADLETFAQAFLQNGGMWDVLADLFPTAKASELRAIMMRAYDQWSRDNGGSGVRA